MKMWLKVTLPLVTMCLVVGFASQAQAEKVSGQASTVLEWYDTADENTAVPLYQYLNLNITNIVGQGWNIRTYGRLSGDLADETDSDLVDSRLYYAYAEKRNLLKDLDVRLGRQFITTTAGSSVMDGAFFNYRELGPLNIALFGGGDVNYYDSYPENNLIWGTEIYGRFFKRLDAGFSYLQKWDHDDLSFELMGLDLDYDIKKGNLYNETQYSLLTEEITYFVFGGVYQPHRDWTLQAEYLYSLPLFASTSIYSVFAADEYEEAFLEVSYLVQEGLNAFARYTHEFYDDGIDDAGVFEAGIEKFRTLKFSGYLTGTYRDDPDGQDLYGIKVHAAYLFVPKFEAGVGLHIDVLEPEQGFVADETDGSRVDDTTAQRYWVDATAYLTPKLNVQGKVEYVESDLWDEYFRGRLRLNILF